MIAILLLNQGCAALEVGIPPFTGKFQHCARAAAAGDGAKSALLNLGLSEDLASTTGETVEKAVVDALDRGGSPEEVARAATDAVIEVAGKASASPPQSSDGDEESTLFGGDGDGGDGDGGDADSTLFGSDTTGTVSGSDTARSVFAAAASAAAAAAASNSVESAAPAAKAAADAAVIAAIKKGFPDDVAEAAKTGTEIGIREARLEVEGEEGPPKEPLQEEGPPKEPLQEEPREEEPRGEQFQ